MTIEISCAVPHNMASKETNAVPDDENEFSWRHGISEETNEYL